MTKANELKDICEAKMMTPRDLVKMLKGYDWGYTEEGGNGEALVKGDNVIIRDSFFYGEDRALKQLITSWSPKGSMYEYFKKGHGIIFEIISSSSRFQGGKMYGKTQKEGVTELTLKIVGA